eukprot:scaffold90995_cov38-Prasinocladus_malaysianus.AAC.1
MPVMLVQTLGHRPLELETWLLADELLSNMHVLLKSSPEASTCAGHLANVVRTKITSGASPMSALSSHHLTNEALKA